MADMLGIFSKALDRIAAETVERDYIFVNTPFMEAPTEETKRKAREFRERLEANGKLFEYLEATVPKPCPECGRGGADG